MQEANYLGAISGTPAAEPFLQGRNALQHPFVTRCLPAAVAIASQNALARGKVLLGVFRQNGKQRSDLVGIAAIRDRFLHLGHHPHDNVVLSHDHWIGWLRGLL